MNYSFFLFTQLYNEIVGIQYEYDLLFEDLQKLFSQYEASHYNDPNIHEYECMVYYLKHNEDRIRKECAERGLCIVD